MHFTSSMAMQRAVFMQCVRWGVWSPFSDPDDPHESVHVSLQGGALPNPCGVMVYTAHTQQTNAERSFIKFKFIYNTEGATSTTMSKSVSQEKPQTKKWQVTSQDESKLGLEASPLRTTRGPGLSLSQLAVSSHFPTRSHTTGSPWQQQLPAPFALSPMASAHQLSHVVHPPVGIAHLEVSAMEREGLRDAPEEECDLHELTFTPVHAPVITLGTHTSGSNRTSSRGFLAHLFSRFPEIRDDFNQVVELLDPDEPVNFDPHREEADPLQANTLLLQFLAFSRKSTTDAIFALRILMEKYRDGQRELHCVFVDLEKAYDRVPREELWYCMRKSGVAEKYVRVVQDMYERSRTVVRCAVGQTEEFKVEVGLHQGSALSPFLFAIVMDQLSEEVRQPSPWTMMFADDIVICSKSREQVEENLERWRFALERRGMKVSRSKTEYMCVNEREGSGTVRLQGEEVKKVQEFKYLGSTVQSNGECGKEVKKRVQAGWNGWRKVSGVLCDRKISARIKGKVYRTVVRPAMLYGLETASLRKRQESELEVAELKMLRCLQTFDPMAALLTKDSLFSRVHQAGMSTEWPSIVHFSFQLYRFPPITTQRLRLVASEASSRPDYPCILSVTNKDGSIGSVVCVPEMTQPSVAKSQGGKMAFWVGGMADFLPCQSQQHYPIMAICTPGLQLQYRVDPAFLKPGERIWFLRYLALHTLHIDVWDSDSLLLIGSAAVPLKHLLRQGRTAVQVIHELEVISTEYLQDASLAREHAGGQRAIPAMSVHTVVKGRLLIRLGNIGGVVQKNPNPSVLLPPSRSHVIQPSQTPTGFQGGSLSSNAIHNLNAWNTRRAQRLPDIDGELANLLQSRMKEVDGAWLQSRGETEEVRQRKIERMTAVRQHEGNTTYKMHEKASYMRRKEDHSQDLRLIEAYRERCKVEGIINMLSQAITTTHTIYATLGTAEFFEFVLKNPFNIPQTVTIECEDPELSVIVNAEEWRYFKDMTKTCTALEVEMFHMKEDSSTPQVYLRPRESVHIPLKYQSFVSGHALLSQDSKTSNSLHFAQPQQSNTVMAKSIKVFFQAADSQPLAICQVRVEPTPHIVDQTFRFYQPELSFFKKAIRLPPAEPGTPVLFLFTITDLKTTFVLCLLFLSHTYTLSLTDAGSRLQVRCSDPNVICHVITTAPGEPQDIYLKVPGAPSPQIKTFVISVFNDPWLASPTQTWQVYMHYLQKMDISCVCGTLSWHSLVLRGTQSIRKVKCYTSHPLELQVDPEEVFALPAVCVQDIRLGVKALHSGSCFRYLNVVDVDTRQLVASWLLCLTCRQPVLSRAFEIQVPVGGGKGSNKKISFTNPYPTKRAFRLSSDHPDLLQFKEEKFQIEGGASYNIGLRFAPSQSAGTEEILVFINDLEDKNEETYCIKVVYR
ncbi:hypothetical protein QTP70_029591 [Hemibagrus guttatus]|uniref:ribonuclease H n=1 Tax=Hemibagrus guttatus TaxID=175788 RepID=A0AAE0R300_9TELE|nr:hypothetical protein QTP70_029591 [Hemibagrus guttatus]